MRRAHLCAGLLLFLAAWLPGGALAGGPVELSAWLTPATLKVFPDSHPPRNVVVPFTITAVRNEYAPFQVVVSSVKGAAELRIDVPVVAGQKAALPVSGRSMLLVENVPVEKPSLPGAGDAAKKAPLLWPDPLPPLQPFRLEEGRTRAAWIDLFVPGDTPPGLYEGFVLVSVKEGPVIRLPFTVDVRDITLPRVPTVRTAFGNRSVPACLQKMHRLSTDDPRYTRLIEEYYWFLVEHRLSPYYIPVGLFSEEAHRFLDDPRVTFFAIPMDWGAEKGSRIWHDGEMKRLSNRLEETGWIEKGAFYVIDEPAPEMLPDVVRVGQRIHDVNPRFKYLMTSHSSHLLFDKSVLNKGQVDIWVPLLTLMSSPPEREVLLKEQERGKELWWYTCSVPKWRGLNYFIDEVATAPRLHPWMNYLYGTTGILYWSTDYWREVDCDPWHKTETYPGANGDGSLLYPGQDGPVASIRLKMLREGLEDYELLKLLGLRLEEVVKRLGSEAADYKPEKRLFEHAMALITEEGRSNPLGEATPYLKYVTTDYREVERRRAMVIDEIETALQAPLLLVATLPFDNGFTFGADAEVHGYVSQGATVEVNDARQALKGTSFHLSVPLSRGRNAIIIKARTADGRTRTIKRNLYRR